MPFFSIINPTWPGLGSNLGHQSGKLSVTYQSWAWPSWCHKANLTGIEWGTKCIWGELEIYKTVNGEFHAEITWDIKTKEE
jgi:hypothetical protein